MWPVEYTELKRIEDLLVCGICYDYMETCVITSCSHNYCSLCIRKYLHYKNQCPACFAETFEKDLRKNKVLDEVISCFSRVRQKLQGCQRGQGRTPETKDASVKEPSPKEPSPNVESPLARKDNKAQKDTPSRSHKSPSLTKKNLSSPGTSGNPKISLFFTPKSKQAQPVSEEGKTVTCPVCKVVVSEKNINRHLDDCLKRERIKKEAPITEEKPKRKPLPKLVLSLMKDTVLRKKLKELGLASQGDRKTLESRLQKYIILYNAECDKSSPRPVADLLKQCEEEESVEKRSSKLTLSANRLQVNRNTEQNVIDDERKKYLEAHKHSFETLITKIKETQTPKKPVRRSILGETSDRQEVQDEDPVNRLADNAEESNDFQPLDYDEIDVQNSDSDTSCPLQTYSSVDPKKSVNNEPSSPPGYEHPTDVLQQGICSTPKGRGSMQIRKSVLKSETEKETRRTTAVKEEDPENGRPNSVLQDLACDVSSNDSFEYKYNGGRPRTELDEFMKETLAALSNLEKENISSPRAAKRSLRKRSNDSLPGNPRPVPGKRLRRMARACLSENEESNAEETIVSVLQDNENARSMRSARSKPRESTAVVRKSARANRLTGKVLQ